MGLKLRVLYLGKMEFPRFRLVECDNEDTMVVSPAVALLIQHPTLGNILYDTGNSADFLKTYTPEMLHNYPLGTLTSSSSPTSTSTTLGACSISWAPRPSTTSWSPRPT